MDCYVLHTRPHVGIVAKIFGVAVGEDGLERATKEMANYSEDAQKIMMITKFPALQ